MTATATTPDTKASRPAIRCAKLAANVLLLGALAVSVLAMLLPAVLGLQRYVIVSGSMTGTYDRGAVVYAKEAPVSELLVGDVITYAPPAGSPTPHDLVTHRIATIERDPKGRPIFRTKGDANATVDPWTFTLDAPTQARASFGVPYVGFFFATLADRSLRMLLIGVPALLIALLTVVRFVRESRTEARAQRPTFIAT